MTAQLLGESDHYDVYEDLQARLVREFPNMPVSLVEAVVRRWAGSFDGARVAGAEEGPVGMRAALI
jgi:hypothetical protein